MSLPSLAVLHSKPRPQWSSYQCRNEPLLLTKDGANLFPSDGRNPHSASSHVLINTHTLLPVWCKRSKQYDKMIDLDGEKGRREKKPRGMSFKVLLIYLRWRSPFMLLLCEIYYFFHWKSVASQIILLASSKPVLFIVPLGWDETSPTPGV